MATSSSPSLQSGSILKTPHGEATEVTIQFFLTHVLPLLPAGMDPASLISKNPRIPRAVGKLITGKGRLWGFPQDPSKLGKAERKTYEALTRSAEAIATTGAEEGLRQTVHLQHNKKGISRFDKRHEDTTFPDAYMLSCAGSDREVIWSHIAISGAYHKKNTIERAKEVSVLHLLCCEGHLPPVDKNARKVTQSMFNCMYQDPRRRFTYGYTIEDTSMKLWFCDRSQLLVSTPYDFITVSDLLITECLCLTLYIGSFLPDSFLLVHHVRRPASAWMGSNNESSCRPRAIYAV